MDDALKQFRWAYKKPRSGRIKVHSVWAKDENGALKVAPEVLDDGWRRYGFLGEVNR